MRYLDSPIEKGVVLIRHVNTNTREKEVHTNVPWTVKYHSPTGFEWGYAGSGPADLALNLAELVVEKAELETTYGAQCSYVAWNAKLTVKELIVMHIHDDGGYVPWKMVCYAVLDTCTPTNRQTLQNYIDNLE